MILFFCVLAIIALMSVATEQPDGSVLYPDGSRFRYGELVEERQDDTVTFTTPVGQLAFLTPGVRRALEGEGKLTVADLLESSDEELIEIKGVAEKTVASIRQFLEELGLGQSE